MVTSVPALGCLDDNVATEFVSGALTGAQVTKVESHLAGCADCRSLVAALATTSDEDSDIHTRPHLIGHAATLPTQPQAPHPFQYKNNQVGRYLFLDAIGAGGMGVVFSAYDPHLGRKVAIKLLRAGGPLNANEARARLRREAQAIAQLNHPNVVGVYDVGTTEAGDVYVAMEFVDGDTLTTWLPRWNRSWRDIVDIFVQAGRGLAAAHEEGLLHRDFKPDNVLVGADGRPRVGDFGLARSLITPDEQAAPMPQHLPGVSSPLTATGTVLGTPRYMPPEQLTGAVIDARSDQFAFCVALYEALFRLHPLPGETAVSMVERGARALAPPDGHKVPPVVIGAIMRGLEREPARRFPSMTVLLAELTRPQRSRSTAWIAAGAFGIAGATAAAVVLVTRSTAAPIPIPDPINSVLIRQVSELDQQLQQALVERQQLRQQLLKALEARDNMQDDLVVLQDQLSEQLEEKDEQIDALNLRVRRLQRQATAIGDSNARSDLKNAAEEIGADLTGCFSEWRERHPKGGILFTVSMTLNSNGKGEGASTSEVADSSLPLCVRGALLRATYPRGEKRRVVFEVSSTEGNPPSLRLVDARLAPPSEIIELD